MALRITKENAKALGPAVEALVAGEKKPSKYKNHPALYNGVRYSSKLEARRARQLDEAVAAGVLRIWIPQPVFRLGVPENKYVADYFVVDSDGSYRAEDCKGAFTRKFQKDRRLWLAYGPCDLWVIWRDRTEVITPKHLERAEA